MKFSIERAALLDAVGQAQAVVERRNTIPILANVLIEADGDGVRFKATDLDIEVIDLGVAQVEAEEGLEAHQASARAAARGARITSVSAVSAPASIVTVRMR